MDDYQEDTRYAEDVEMDGDEYGPYDDGPGGDFEYEDAYQDDAADFEARELSHDLEMDWPAKKRPGQRAPGRFSVLATFLPTAPLSSFGGKGAAAIRPAAPAPA